MKQRIAILGGGESGSGAAVLAINLGFDVFVSDFGSIKTKYKELLDEHNIEWEENQHTENLILNANEIIKSPGVPDNAPIVKLINQQKINLISEIEFAGRYTDAKKICITGSNGKTTTTLLTYHIFKNAGINVGVAGNVGKSFALQVANEIINNKPMDYYILELSSFQLDGMRHFKADLAIMMNITPDHLDRYDNELQNYIESKFRIIQNQTKSDYFIYNADDKTIIHEMEKQNILSELLPISIKHNFVKGAYVEGEGLKVALPEDEFTMNIEDLALEGNHNIYNSMAASISSKLAGIRNEDIRLSLSDFEGVEHRLEPVMVVNGIEFINDSKATNVNSVWYALESMKKPVVWIVGGVDKGNDYSELVDLVEMKVKTIICLGKDNSKLHEAYGDIVKIIDASSMQEAVQAASYNGEQGDVVLLSPACASFDLFTSYEDRGNQFKQEVGKL